MMDSTIGRLVATGGLLCVLCACEGEQTPIHSGDAVDGASDVVNLEQGWSREVQDLAWFTSFGSRLMPYDWLLHLEQAGSTDPFVSGEHMQALGFLVQEPSRNNPDGLPVGFTKVQDKQGLAWVGLGCGACHTGEVHYQGTKIRIDGGPALIDFTGFERSVLEALSATVADADKFDRFARSVLGAGRKSTDLKTGLVSLAEKLQARRHLNQTEVPYGHGRLDAFGQIFNAAAVEFIGMPGNRRAPDAPVSFPMLWGAPHLDLVQWNGSAPNAGPGPLFQNVTTALAVYGHADVQGHNGLAGYPSTADFSNLGKIQEYMYQLKSPVWPEQILGVLDQERIARGERLYAENCESCHQRVDRSDPKRKLKAVLVPVDEVGTDPRMADNFLNATADPGALTGRKAAIVAGDRLTNPSPTIDVVVHVATGAVLRHPLESIRAALESYHKVYKANIDKHPNHYKARSLNGIWATAPYLHNGSVPSLHELLLPPAQRVAEFHVGGRELDVDQVGLATGPGAGRSLFDTGLPGNSNAGHDYGTGLSAEQRLDLVEFLKSI